MKLPKRLGYGFNGYQVPPTPQATRSARRRGTVRRTVEENQICAFDLLATVAGDLLLKNEGSPTSNNASSEKDQCTFVDQDFREGNKLLKMELCDKGSYNSNNVFVSKLVEEENLCSMESSTPQDIDSSGFTSVITSSNCPESLVAGKLSKINAEMASVSVLDGSSSEYTESGKCKLDSKVKTLVKEESHNSEKVLIGTEADMFSSEDPVVCDADPPALVSSYSSAKVPLCGDNTPQKSYPVTQDDVKVVSRDDDENSSGCTHPSTVTKYRKSVSRIGDRRIRKILASKRWKVAPKYKDETYLNTGKGMKPIYHNRKDSNKRQRLQMNIPIKKRKLFYRTLVSNSDGFTGEDYYESCEKGVGNTFDLRSKLQRTGTSCLKAGQSAFQSMDSHVKLRIKSFIVPELFIEIPETATVGSLKKTVMEAVTSILGGGLRVGVLLQGKKVRDDNKTLLHSGISNDNQVDSLGFTLEPNPSKNVPCPSDFPHLLAGNAAQNLASYPSIVHQGTSDVASKEPHASNLESFFESDYDSGPSPIETSMEKSTTESKAIVPMQAMNVEALAMVPAQRKSKRSEMAPRRIRRPFSAAEVEALVEAVEKLGTGRWRDVKIRAFDNAKHRTYVDLKDKWKTLVHTARIAPQQRRGEPVPQELLDRVLDAHAYWSQHQAKQHPESCLLL